MAIRESGSGLSVVLFYKYVALPDAKAAATAQTALCTSLGLAGRIRLADEGINGLLAGPPSAVAQYQAAMASGAMDGLAPFKGGIHYKTSRAATCPFGGKLFVRVCSEITSTGELMRGFGALGGGGGTHLSAREFHEAMLQCQSQSRRGAAGAAAAAGSSCGKGRGSCSTPSLHATRISHDWREVWFGCGRERLEYVRF